MVCVMNETKRYALAKFRLVGLNFVNVLEILRYEKHKKIRNLQLFPTCLEFVR